MMGKLAKPERRPTGVRLAQRTGGRQFALGQVVKNRPISRMLCAVHAHTAGPSSSFPMDWSARQLA